MISSEICKLIHVYTSLNYILFNSLSISLFLLFSTSIFVHCKDKQTHTHLFIYYVTNIYIISITGLFKGSTMTLNNPNAGTFTTHLSTFQQHLQKDDDSSRSRMTSINNNNNSKSSHHNNSENGDDKRLTMMSPFDEQEEWAKINEIMESFGSGIARESVFVNDIENEFRQRLGLSDSRQENDSRVQSAIAEVDENLSPLKRWLAEINLEHIEEHLMENGYDNPDYINGLIANENDLEVCGIPEKDRLKLLTEIFKLTKPPTLIDATQNNKLNNNQHPIPSVDQWLTSIHLAEYVDVFK